MSQNCVAKTMPSFRVSIFASMFASCYNVRLPCMVANYDAVVVHIYLFSDPSSSYSSSYFNLRYFHF